MATDRELITGTVHGHAGGASAVVRAVPYGEYLHLIGTGGGRKMVGALWLPL
jgi:hypothetical protein